MNEYGFKVDYFKELAELEEKHFWFKGRNQLIFWAFDKYFSKATHFLEVGCGTGYVLSGMAQEFPHLTLSGSELFQEGLAFAKKRLAHAQFFQLDACALPFENQFDVVGSFDVLEHIVDDVAALQQMHRSIRPGGGLILTVPQHPFLWSQQDSLACHVRRYTSTELKNKVMNAGFKIIEVISFVSLLFPFLYVSRFLKTKHADALAELKLPRTLNLIFETLMNLERQLIKKGVRIPFGGSLLLIAEKTT